MTTVTSKEFGKTKAGQSVTAFELKNENGMLVRILDLGGIIQSVIVPDRNGNMLDVALGYDDVESYENGSCYYGAVVGRYANRIGGGRFTLDGKEYILETNEEGHHIHGVFPKRIFDSSIDGEDLMLHYFSPDMEEGYPGNFSVDIRYHLSGDNALEITYTATADAPTIVNLTNHSYFNLNGQDGSEVLDHRLWLNCIAYTQYTETFAQTGKIIPVENTPMDFRKEHIIRESINEEYPPLRVCTGYDHNMVLGGSEGELKPIGTLKSDKSGICLEAFTTEPAIQLYTANFIHCDPVPFGKNGIRYPRQGALCFEAQHYPDALNHPHFPNTVLRPDDVYSQKTVYRFKTF